MRRAAIVLALASGCCSSPAATPHGPTQPTTPDAAVGTTATSNPPPPDPDAPTVRLPGDVRPTRAALELTIDPTQASFTGHLHAEAQVVTATRVVWLDADGLTLSNAKIGDAAARIIAGGNHFAGLVLDAELAPGPITVDVDYTAAIDHDKSQGVYAVQEGAETYAYTFFEPIDARRAFPCWDEPAYKIPWQLTFHVASTSVALGNAPVASETDDGNGMKTVTLAESKPLPSYLVAFVVGPFDVIDDGVAGRAKTPIRFIIPKGREPELHYAKIVTPKVVAALEDYFDMDYPYGKLDVAVVPRYWGTMEHPGIVAMGQPLTLIKPDAETRNRRESYANILSHEMSHYWFGDYVTMAWWDDTWLNEALGEFEDLHITDAVEPSWHYPDERVDLAAAGMSADELPGVKSMRQPVATEEAIEASFDNGITYYKGSSVMRMFEGYVGADKWRDFLRAYVRKFAWGNATADDFIGVMSDQLGADVADAFRTFLVQPGVPLVTHQQSCSAGKATLALHQVRALPVGSSDPSNPIWKVPVCVAWRAGAKHGRACQILDAADGTIELPACPTQVVMNDDATGYYRSAYTVAEAKALLAKKAGLPSVVRRSITGDVSAAVARGEIGVADSLALMPTLAADADDKVAAAALQLAAPLSPGGLDDDQYARAKRFFVKALGPLAHKLGWLRKKGDSDNRQRLRLYVVPSAAASGDARLVADARKLTETWMKTGKGLEDDTVGAVLATAARSGDAKFFDALLAKARATTNHREQGRFFRVLGEFVNPALSARALDLVLGSEFNLRDKAGILYGQLYSRETRDATWTWLQAHIAELLKGMRDDEAAGTISAIPGAFCDAAHRKEAESLLTPLAANFDGAANALGESLGGVDQCIALTEHNRAEVTAFLSKY